jgi:hypothetical protein
MDSKVLRTLAILAGVLALLYVMTDKDVPTTSEQSEEQVAVEETSEEVHSMMEEAEHMPEEMMAEEAVGITEDMMQHAEYQMAEEMSESETMPEMMEQEAEEELTFKPKAEKLVTGYAGDDFASF